MKDDTISRAAAVKALEETKQSDPFNRYEYQNIGIDWSIDAIKALPSAQPSVSKMEIVEDCISRAAVLNLIEQSCCDLEYDCDNVALRKEVEALPSAQPNLSEAYSKTVFTWLMDYQIRAAELKGRYTPYEVLSWVANDWRKEHERFD